MQARWSRAIEQPLKWAIVRRFIRQQDGATAVEFAMVAAPFLAMMFAIIETALVHRPVVLIVDSIQTVVSDELVTANLLRSIPIGRLEAHANLRLQQLRQDIHVLEDQHLEKILRFFDDHWDQALRYLRKKGMGTHRRGSNSESGMRLLRRLEKNHDGIRSAATRQHYIQIYQAMKYLSLDVADFIEKGPQLAELPRV